MVGDGVKDKDGVGAEEEIGGVEDMKRGGGHILSGGLEGFPLEDQNGLNENRTAERLKRKRLGQIVKKDNT